MDNYLIKNSKDLCDEAAQVLERIKAFEVLSPLGKIEVVGSLRLKLMYRPDIDLFIISDDINEDKARSITKKFLNLGIFQVIALEDNRGCSRPDAPPGFYWELRVSHKGKNWKFDVWYLKPTERYVKSTLSSIKKFEDILSKNPKKAEIILKIKESYFDGEKYKNQVDGLDIYTAVLEKGINTLEEFTRNVKSLSQNPAHYMKN